MSPDDMGRDDPRAESRAVAEVKRLVRRNLDEAFRRVRVLRRDFPSSKRVRKLYERVKRRKAVQALLLAESVWRRSPSPERAAEVCNLLRICGKWRKAFRTATRADRRFPESWQLKLALGKLHFYRFGETGAHANAESAVEFLEFAHGLNPRNYTIQLLLSICLARVGREAEALEVVQSVLNAWPGDCRAAGLRDHLRTTLRARRQEEADAWTPSAGRTAGEAGAGWSLEGVMELPGAVGVFLFDDNGEVVDSLVRENETFEFSAPIEVLESMATACHLDTHRIGLGDLASCSVSGPGWCLAYFNSPERRFMAFFDGGVLPSEAEESVETLLAVTTG